MGRYALRSSSWAATPYELQHGQLYPMTFSMGSYAPRRSAWAATPHVDVKKPQRVAKACL